MEIKWLGKTRTRTWDPLILGWTSQLDSTTDLHSGLLNVGPIHSTLPRISTVVYWILTPPTRLYHWSPRWSTECWPTECWPHPLDSTTDLHGSLLNVCPIHSTLPRISTVVYWMLAPSTRLYHGYLRWSTVCLPHPLDSTTDLYGGLLNVCPIHSTLPRISTVVYWMLDYHGSPQWSTECWTLPRISTVVYWMLAPPTLLYHWSPRWSTECWPTECWPHPLDSTTDLHGGLLNVDPIHSTLPRISTGGLLNVGPIHSTLPRISTGGLLNVGPIHLTRPLISIVVYWMLAPSTWLYHGSPRWSTEWWPHPLDSTTDLHGGLLNVGSIHLTLPRISTVVYWMVAPSTWLYHGSPRWSTECWPHPLDSTTDLHGGLLNGGPIHLTLLRISTVVYWMLAPSTWLYHGSP
jgi:hypothetical protein